MFWGMALNYLNALILTLSLGAGGFGLFILAITIEAVAALVGRFGLGITVLRFTAWYRGRNDNRNLHVLLKFVILSVSILSTLVAAAVWIIAPLLSQYVFHKPELTPALRIAAWAVPLHALWDVFISGLHGCGFTRQRVYLESIILSVLRLAFCCVALILGPSLKSFLLAIVAAYGLSACIAGLLLARQVRFWDTPLSVLPDLGLWVKFSVPAFLDALLVSSLGGTVETMLLGIMSTKEAVGIFNIIMRLKQILDMPMKSYNTSLAPLIGEVHGRGDHVSLKKLYLSATRWIMMLGLPLAAMMVICGRPLLGLFGPSFTAGYIALICVVMGQLTDVTSGPTGHLLLMAGYARVRLLNSLIMVAEQIGLSILFIPRLGITGVGLVIAISISTINIIQLAEVFFLLKIHPLRPELCKPLTACFLAGGVVGIIGLRIQENLWISGALLFGFIMTYLLLLVGFGLHSEDKVLLLQTSKRLAGHWDKLNRLWIRSC